MEIIAKEIKTKYTIKLNQNDFEEIIMDLQKELLNHNYIVCLLGRNQEKLKPFYEWLKGAVAVSEIKDLMENPLSDFRSLLVGCWCYKNEYDIQFYGNYKKYDKSVEIVAYRDGVIK